MVEISDRLKRRLEELGTGTPVKSMYSRHLINSVQSFYLALRERPGEDLAKDAAKLVDEAVEMHIASGLEVDCKPGCNHCCNQEVTVTDPEMDVIMKTKLMPLTLSPKLRKQIVAGDDFYQLSNEDRKCVFLQEFGCGIYNDRPLICRLIHSRAVKTCIEHDAIDPAIPDYAEAVYTAYLTVLNERGLLKKGRHNMLHKQLYKRLSK